MHNYSATHFLPQIWDLNFCYFLMLKIWNLNFHHFFNDAYITNLTLAKYTRYVENDVVTGNTPKLLRNRWGDFEDDERQDQKQICSR